MDRRGEESRKKAGLRLFLFYLPLLPLTLLPGFFSEAAVSHTAYLLLPYALEAVTVVLTGAGLLSFLFHAKATVDGRVYRLQFQRFLGRAAMSCILGIGFFLVLCESGEEASGRNRHTPYSVRLFALFQTFLDEGERRNFELDVVNLILLPYNVPKFFYYCALVHQSI